MASISSSQATVTIPAAYLEDVRTALIKEIADDSEALQGRSDSDERGSSLLILCRDMRLLDEVLDATDDIKLTAEHDQMSSPLIHLLEGMVRQLVERLRDVAQYGPLPMGELLDLTERMRWAAREATRIEPEAGDRLSDDEAVAFWAAREATRIEPEAGDRLSDDEAVA
jgi:hypothetical protein